MLVIRQVLGFWIQILPCAFLCLYPFKSDFKAGLRKSLSVSVSIFLIMTAVFAAAGAAPYPAELEGYRFSFQEIVFCITLVLLLALYIFLIKESKAKKLFIFFIVMNYGFLIMSAQNLSYELFDIPYNSDGYMYPAARLSASLCVNILLFVPMLFFIKHLRHSLKSHIAEKQWKILWKIPAVFIILSMVFYEIPSQTQILSAEKVSEVFMMIMILFSLSIYIWLFNIINQSRKQAEETARLELVVENYRKTSENIAEIKKMRHEINHHLAAVRTYIKQNDLDSAEKYLNSVTEIMPSELPIEYTPHPLINSILAQYSEYAAAKNIKTDFSAAVPEHINIDDIDICCLLTNILDNAFEACSRIKGKEVFINLSIHQKSEFLYIGCTNTCETAALRYSSGKLISNKSNPSRHGNGLKLIEEITEKYNGLLNIETDCNKFTVQANICLSCTDKG